MKIKGSQLDPVAQRILRHRVSMYQRHDDVIVQRATGAPQDRLSPKQLWYQGVFGLLGRMTTHAISQDYLTAVEMVKGTLMVPRDFLTMCYTGSGYVIDLWDGRQTHREPTYPTPTHDRNKTMLIDGTAMDIYARTPNATPYAQLGQAYRLPWNFRAREIWIAINGLINQQYVGRLAILDSTNLVVDYVEGAPETVWNTGVRYYRWETPMLIPAGSRIAIIAALISATGTTPCRAALQSGNRPVYPDISVGTVAYDTTTLAIGQAMAATPSNSIATVLMGDPE